MEETCLINVSSVYDIIAIIISLCIIISFSFSFYYGCKTCKLKKRKLFSFQCTNLITLESFLWVGLFIYILIGSIGPNKIIQNDSFGAIFIRPLILLTGIITTIRQERRYKIATAENYFQDISEKKCK